jgi:nucleoside-diphosphate-sugar epimerase/pimeloyl-ACP methyl ester carboxylesterase
MTMHASNICVTGATGFVGSHFVYHLLSRSSAGVVAVVRGNNRAEARDRVLKALAVAALSRGEAVDMNELLPRLDVVLGDITRPCAGVQDDAIAAMRGHGVQEIYHFAASLRFEERDREHIRVHNVLGTENVLDLAERLGVKRFVHVSTAYTCGAQGGTVAEELHPADGAFNNVYEQTKCEAEHLVAAWGERVGCECIIARPSIVVGPAHTRRPGGSDTGLYGFVREVYRVRDLIGRAERGMTLRGDPGSALNFVPVDDVVSELWGLRLRDFEGRTIHHLTAKVCPTVRDLVRATARHCQIKGLDVAEQRDHEASAVEHAFDRRARFYASYLRNGKVFARASGSPIAVTDAHLDAYIHEYVRELRQETPDVWFERQVVRADDACLFNSYAFGPSGGSTVILANAYGMPVDCLLPLAKELGRKHRVLTWDMRGFAASEAGRPAPTPHQHAADLRRLMDCYGVTRAHLVGWCTGADIALLMAELAPERVQSVVCINGALNAAKAEESSFQRDLRNLVRTTSRSLSHSKLYHALIFGNHLDAPQLPDGSAAPVSNYRRERAELNNLIGEVDPTTLHFTSAPFREPMALHLYARSMAAYYGWADASPLPQPSCPVLLLHAEDDKVVSPDTSLEAASQLGGVDVLTLASCDHLSVYTDPRFAKLTSSFVERVQTVRSVSLLPTLPPMRAPASRRFTALSAKAG